VKNAERSVQPACMAAAALQFQARYPALVKLFFNFSMKGPLFQDDQNVKFFEKVPCDAEIIA
jgi:hypothetical protein